MTKRYIKWTAKKVNDNFYKHPNTDRLETKDAIFSFTETGFGDGQNTYLGIVAYDESKADSIKLVAYKNKVTLKKYNPSLLTMKEVNTLMKQWYGDDYKYFKLGDDGFTIIDNRPILEDD